MHRLNVLRRRISLHPALSRRVILLAYPVALGMLSITLLNVVDTAMLGRLGSVELAAAGISGVGYFAIVFSVAGIGIGVQSLTSRRYGEGKCEQCGEVLSAGLSIAIVTGIVFVIAAPWLAKLLAPMLSEDPHVASLGQTYLRYRFLAALSLMVNQVYGGFFNGVGHTKRQMTAAVIITAANIALDYALIFGHVGAPALGVAGAAIASVIATGIGTAYYVSVSLLHSYRHTYHLYRQTGFQVWLVPILRLSLPVAGQRALSNGSFFLFFSIVSRIGTVELAATNVIRSVLGVSIMPAIGIAVAAATLVGQNLGRKRARQAERYAWEAAKLASYFMGVIGLMFVFLPGTIFRIYTADQSVIDIGRTPLLLLGVVQTFGGVALVIARALQGAGNTGFVMLVELGVCSVIYLPAAYFLGLHFGGGMIGAWSGEYLYWLSLALVLSWKFRQGTWKSIKI